MPKKTLYAELILCDAPKDGPSAFNQLGLIKDGNGKVTGIKVGDGIRNWKDLDSVYYTKNEINQLVKGSGSVFFDTPEEMKDELLGGSTTDYVQGQAIFLINNDFPDVWIVAVENDRVEYQEEIATLQATLIAGKTVQIGHFKIQILQGNLHGEMAKKLDHNGLEWVKTGEQEILTYDNKNGAIQILGERPTAANTARPQIKISPTGLTIENNNGDGTRATCVAQRHQLKFAQYDGTTATSPNKQTIYTTSQIIYQPSAKVKNELTLPSGTNTGSSPTAKDGVNIYKSTLATQNWTQNTINAAKSSIIEQVSNTFRSRVQGRFVVESTMRGKGAQIKSGLEGWGRIYLYTGEGLRLTYEDGTPVKVGDIEIGKIGTAYTAKILIIILPENYYDDIVPTYRCKAIWSSDSLGSANIKDFTLPYDSSSADLGRKGFRVRGNSGASEWKL